MAIYFFENNHTDDDIDRGVGLCGRIVTEENGKTVFID